MLISRLKLIDLRQFYKENEMAFSTDRAKNVTLIHAENGVGKTALLNAILWCLYEEHTANFEQPNDILNHSARKEGRKKARVELEFLSEGQLYQAVRWLDASDRETTFRVYKVEEQNFIPIPQPRGFINSIVPQDMAHYFFFQGEGVSKIASHKDQSDVRRAIRDILGFTLAEQAIDDLREYRKKITKEVSTLEGVEKATKHLSARALALEEEVESERKVETEQQRNLRTVESDLSQVVESLINSGNQKAEQLERLHLDLAKQKDRLDVDLNKARGREVGLIQEFGWIAFGIPLAEHGISDIDTETMRGRIPAPYNEQLVKDLLEREECICGRELKPMTAAFGKIQDLLDAAGSTLVYQRIMRARSVASNVVTKSREFLDRNQSVSEQIGNLHAAIRDAEVKIKETREELAKIDNADVQHLEGKRTRLEKEKAKILRTIGALQAKIEIGEAQRKSVEAEIRRHSGQDSRLLELQNRQAFIDRLITHGETKLADFEEGSRVRIVTGVNEILEQFSRKDYRIRMDSDYGFHLVRADGSSVAKSDGERLLLNLSFVVSLIGLARERAGAEGNFLQSGASAPFVVDAPFGDLDETYKEGTAKFLPERSEQIVFLLSSSHWKGTVDKMISDRVGCEYLCVSHKTIPRGSRPLDAIEIAGQRFDQSVYQSSFDGTTVRRIR